MALRRTRPAGGPTMAPSIRPSSPPPRRSRLGPATPCASSPRRATSRGTAWTRTTTGSGGGLLGAGVVLGLPRMDLRHRPAPAGHDPAARPLDVAWGRRDCRDERSHTDRVLGDYGHRLR